MAANITADELLAALNESSLGAWNHNEHNADAASELAARGLAEVIDTTAERNRSRKTMGLVRVCREVRLTAAGRAALVTSH